MLKNVIWKNTERKITN